MKNMHMSGTDVDIGMDLRESVLREGLCVRSVTTKTCNSDQMIQFTEHHTVLFYPMWYRDNPGLFSKRCACEYHCDLLNRNESTLIWIVNSD